MLQQLGEMLQDSINSFDKIDDSTVTITKTDGETDVMVEIKLIPNEMLSEQQQQMIKELVANSTEASEDNISLSIC